RQPVDALRRLLHAQRPSGDPQPVGKGANPAAQHVRPRLPGNRFPRGRVHAQRGRGWLVTYAVSSTIYRWIILFGITLFLYTVLKPYELQSIGVTLAWASLVGIVSSLVVNVTRVITAPRQKPLSKTRIAATLATLAAFSAAALAIPLPLHVYAP